MYTCFSTVSLILGLFKKQITKSAVFKVGFNNGSEDSIEHLKQPVCYINQVLADNWPHCTEKN